MVLPAGGVRRRFCQHSRQTRRHELQDEFRLRCFEDCERSSGMAEVKQATAAGGDMLVVADAGAEEVAELVVASTEALRRREALEAAHASDPPLDAAVVLLQTVVLVGAGAMRDALAQRRADRPRVGAVPVRGDPVRDPAGDRLRRTEEGLGRRHVPVLAQHGVDQIAIPVDGPGHWCSEASGLGRIAHLWLAHLRRAMPGIG